jgi:hypothetical protein
MRRAYARCLASQWELAGLYDLSQRAVSMIVRGETWVHAPGPIVRRRRFQKVRKSP